MPSTHALPKYSYHRNAVSCNIYTDLNTPDSGSAVDRVRELKNKWAQSIDDKISSPALQPSAKTFREKHRRNRRLKLQQAQTSPAVVDAPDFRPAQSVSLRRQTR